MSDRPRESVEERLQRVQDALARTEGAALVRGAPRTSIVPSAMMGGASLVVLGATLATGNVWLLPLAGVFALSSVLVAFRRRNRRPRDLSAPHIGMGATVAEDAVIEPGAVVEMGATIGPRAVIRSGAVVRMGADVKADAVVESGAVIGWGATVHSDAVVGEGARVGSGSDVQQGARVPPRMTLMPGTTYKGGGASSQKSAPPAARDDRLLRVEAACDRLAGELKSAPQSVRDFIGGGVETIEALRATCRGLLQREAALRREASPEALKRLDDERDVLQARADQSPDAAVRASLQGALKAIAEQKQHRERLGVEADRLAAELTRLTFTLEGMGAQLVRVRNTTAPESDAELGRALGNLHDEIDAISRALEDASGFAPVQDLREENDPTRRQPGKLRE